MRADQFDPAEKHDLTPDSLLDMLKSRCVKVHGQETIQEPELNLDDAGETEFIEIRVPEHISRTAMVLVNPSDLIRARVSGDTVFLPAHPHQQLVPIQFAERRTVLEEVPYQFEPVAATA